ncbi:hypothetical protein KDX27_35070 [Burkholderia cenocepacia]|uniref:hypothetical protein n=1 Tax=Burkholderia cenocepacia TaxID=95486 RepID=UPI001B943360|nr:hypothetical protein [Burkholderia cenocepacia]MBR8029210.1 hypothetical protein [Burkholderia cenocepacia]MBR8172952.1 hypothetical protein [Burkholderia cenocepacia]
MTVLAPSDPPINKPLSNVFFIITFFPELVCMPVLRFRAFDSRWIKAHGLISRNDCGSRETQRLRLALAESDIPEVTHSRAHEYGRSYRSADRARDWRRQSQPINRQTARKRPREERGDKSACLCFECSCQHGFSSSQFGATLRRMYKESRL